MTRPTSNPDHRSSQAGEGPCCSAEFSPLPEAAIADDVEVLATLGNDTRYEALRMIADSSDGICVCDLEPHLGVSQGAISQALSRLFSAGLVNRRKEGRWRYYSSTYRGDRLLEVLDETRAVNEDRGGETRPN